MFHNVSMLPKIVSAIIISSVVVTGVVLTNSAIQSRGDVSPTDNENTKIVNIDEKRVYLGEDIDSRTETVTDMFTRVQKVEDASIKQERKMNEVLDAVKSLQQQLVVNNTTEKSNEAVTKFDEATEFMKGKFTNIEEDLKLLKQGKAPLKSVPNEKKVIDESDVLPIGATNNKFVRNNSSVELRDPYEDTQQNKVSTSVKNDGWVYPKNAYTIVDEETQEVSIVVPAPETRKTQVDTSNTTQDTADLLIPLATIPDGATLLQSRTLTALVGRVPVGQQVVDPYPFKLKVGKNNLASNYKRIPGLDGIIIQGKTRGDRTLTCVIADVMKMTFTFNDGTVTTVPSSEDQSDERIGYLSDNQGVPCISGININNRLEYISQNIGLDAFQAAARALADNERTRIIDSSGTTTEVATGDSNKIVLGETLAAGAESGASIASDFLSEAFEAIYVSNNRNVTLHVERELPIDYDPNGRKLFYDNNIPGHSNRANFGRL